MTSYKPTHKIEQQVFSMYLIDELCLNLLLETFRNEELFISIIKKSYKEYQNEVKNAEEGEEFEPFINNIFEDIIKHTIYADRFNYGIKYVNFGNDKNYESDKQKWGSLCDLVRSEMFDGYILMKFIFGNLTKISLSDARSKNECFNMRDNNINGNGDMDIYIICKYMEDRAKEFIFDSEIWGMDYNYTANRVEYHYDYICANLRPLLKKVNLVKKYYSYFTDYDENGNHYDYYDKTIKYGGTQYIEDIITTIETPQKLQMLFDKKYLYYILNNTKLTTDIIYKIIKLVKK
jgi:hypothetical protein